MTLTADPVWLTKRQAAAIAQVSISTIEQWIRDGKLRAGGVGHIRIKREWLDEALEGRR